MKVEHLEYFIDFVETRSVSATAGHFYLSTQGMSRALHQLEKESGYVLFDNEGGYLKLTRAGRLFAEHARHMVEDYRAMQKALRGMSPDAVSGASPVRVLATPAANRYLTPFLDLQNLGSFPFDVLLREGSLSECVELLGTHAPARTLGLVSLPVTEKYLGIVESPDEKGLIFEPLVRSSVVALVSTSSHLSREGELRQSDVASLKCGYLLDEMLLDYVDDYVREEDLRTVTSNLSILEDQIAANQIVTFMVKMYFATRRLPTGVTALPCPDAPKVLFGFLGVEQSYADDDLALVRDAVRKTLKKGVDDDRFAGLYEYVG